MDAEQQEQQAFERAFAEASGTEPPISTAQPAAEVVTEPEPELSKVPGVPEPFAEEPENPESAAPKEEHPAQPKANPEDEDPVLLDGLKRSELHRLFGNAADVDSLKKQLDKAHGNIGELNRKLQQIQQPAPVASPSPAMAPELSPELRQIEQDYPEVAQLVRALVPQHAVQAAPSPQPEQAQSAPMEAPVQVAGSKDSAEFEVALLDRMHKGWRDKVGSQDFNVWIAAQGEKVKSQLDAAATADEVVAVIGHFDQWAAARTAAAEKSAKGQHRLKQATTPGGNSPKPQAAPTEQEAMEAAFKRILGQ